MSSIMAHASLGDAYLYRHKKFDQAKRKRTDSSSSTSSDYELRNELETERQIHPFLTQINNVGMQYFNWPALETLTRRSHTLASNIDQELPAAKRPCNHAIISDSNHAESVAQRSQILSSNITSSTNLTVHPPQVHAVKELPALKRSFSPDQVLPPAKRPCFTAAIASNTTQYGSEKPYNTTVSTESDQRVPQTKSKCLSAQKPSTSALNTRLHSLQGLPDAMPVLDNEVARNFGAASNLNQNLAFATRPRSFSASISSRPYPFAPLTQIPLVNKAANLSLKPASEINCHISGSSAVNASSTTAHLEVTKRNPAAGFITDSNVTPVTRQRSFSASAGNSCPPLVDIGLLQHTNISLNLKKQPNRSLTIATNTKPHLSSSPRTSVNFNLKTDSSATSCGKANPLSASNANRNTASATRPRSFSASTGSSTSSFASLNQLRLTNTNVASPVIPPTSAILPKISHETLSNICKYHSNMVRKFPKKERSPKDQERRNKNTIACRMSRRVKKLEHIAIEEQYKEFSQQTYEIIEKSIRATAYLNELMKLCKSPERKSKSLQEVTKSEKVSGMRREKKPFTIAYLTGTEEK